MEKNNKKERKQKPSPLFTTLTMANYGRKLRVGANIKRKEKIKKIIEFVERMKKIHKEIGVVLKKR